ncbi:MAG: hypothetical protein QMD11_09705 [Smithella sp.]|nr:hypothetical protein [Smithella sp.]
MKPIYNILKLALICTVVCVTMMSTAYASGYIFDWEPFTADKSLVSDTADNKSFINDSPLLDLYISGFDNFYYGDLLSDDRENSFNQKNERSSWMGNIRINLSPSFTISDDRYKIYADNDEAQASKYIDAMTALIYDDSKIKSLETIGKMVGPQIRFYFEF